MVEVRVRAAAKINLHLGVGRLAADGYHPLVTVFQAVGLYDDVTVRDADAWRLDVTVADHIDAGGVPGEGNIVQLAARVLCAERAEAVSVEVAKAIPVAGGMGGGSADGAAALVALDRLWDLRTPDEELLAHAATLGSDVSFSLVGGTAVGTGRGEVLTSVADDATWWWVVVPSRTGLSTPAVYRHWDELFPAAADRPTGAEAVLAALATGRPSVLARALHNDLQPAAFDLRPDLKALIRLGESLGALKGIVSGSGPTCAFLAADAQGARLLADALRSAGHADAMACPAPVHGATVMTA